VKRLPILAVLVLAGCGGAQEQAKPRQPHLPRALAASWRAESNAIAAALALRDGCTAQAHALALRTSVIDAVNARRVSPRFQETLLAAVQDLPDRIGCTPPAPTPTPMPRPHEHPHPPHHHDHGKQHDDRG
jgi:hypothetical protein